MELELDQEGSVDDVYTDEGEWLEAQIRSVVWLRSRKKAHPHDKTGGKMEKEGDLR